MPTTQGTDDFNHAITAGYYVDGFFGTPTAVGSPLYQLQPQSLSIVTNGSNVGVRHNITGSPTRGWAAFPFRFTTLPAGSGYQVANFQSAAADRGALWMGSTGIYISVTGGNGTIFPLSVNTWYWIEMIFDVSTATHQVFGRVNGVDMNSPAGFAAGSASTLSFHQLISLAGDPAGFTNYYGMWKWGSATTNADWLGEPAGGQTLLPDADLATTGWATAPLFSKVADSSDATLITATAA